MDLYLGYPLLAILLGFALTWAVGANDLANIMSTAMGSKSISVRQAIVIAIIFEFAGALFGGSHVTTTIKSGIINTHSAVLLLHPDFFIDGMLATLLAGTSWMMIASYFGLPVSITNTIVGALVGFGAIVLGVSAVHWQQVELIAVSWLCAPLIAGIVAYNLFRNIQSLILTQPEPVEKIRQYAPYYLFIIGMVLSFMTIIKGITHFRIPLSTSTEMLIMLLCGIFTAVFGVYIIRRLPLELIHDDHHHSRFDYVERVFAFLMLLTACAMVFAHGSNDVAIAMGPVAAVMAVAEHQSIHHMYSSHHSFHWQSLLITLLGCGGVVTGLFMYGRKVIQTVGSGITALTPSRAFAATIAAATIVVLATGTGIPVSATQTLVGAVFGVGLARGIGALNLQVIRNILLSWIVTIPAASVLAILFYCLLRLLSPEY